MARQVIRTTTIRHTRTRYKRRKGKKTRCPRCGRYF